MAAMPEQADFDNINERNIRLGPDLAMVPERLLLEHAKGNVLFITGSGISIPSGLPDFRGLVLKVYKELDKPVYNAIANSPCSACIHGAPDISNLNYGQIAEVKRFVRGDYDVVFGMLERRMDIEPHK